MYLLDTNVVIDFCNGRLPTTAKNILVNIEPCISVITHIELFSSLRITETERLRLEQFIGITTIFDVIHKEIVVKSISLRQLYKTPLPDAIIAATALVNGLSLMTRNIDDFKRIEGLDIVDPWAIQ